MSIIKRIAPKKEQGEYITQEDQEVIRLLEVIAARQPVDNSLDR